MGSLIVYNARFRNKLLILIKDDMKILFYHTNYLISIVKILENECHIIAVYLGKKFRVRRRIPSFRALNGWPKSGNIIKCQNIRELQASLNISKEIFIYATIYFTSALTV